MNLKLIGVLAATIALAPACGYLHHSEKAQAPQPMTSQARYQAAVAWAKCMRTHGAPSWPDPGPGGGFPNENGSLNKIRNTAGFKTAQAACKSIAPNDNAPDQAQLQQDYKQLLKYSACMRSHGVPSYPDPILDKSGVGIEDHIDHNTPQFKTAGQACKSLAPAGG